MGNKFKLKQTIRYILTWKSNRDEKSIVQDLNEIFNQRRDRAMRKIQLNKNTKQGNEKKTVLNIIAKKQGKKKKQRTGKKVKS